jgi:hypothetical protein
MVVTSSISRAMRSTELRIRDVELDEQAIAMLAEDDDRVIRLIARRPRVETEEAFNAVDQEVRRLHNLGPDERVCFLEVDCGDAGWGYRRWRR